MLKITLSEPDLQKLFSYLDINQDNFLSYYEFCELSEDRWKGCDPLKVLQHKKLTETNNTLTNFYTLTIQDLEVINGNTQTAALGPINHKFNTINFGRNYNGS